MPMSDTFPRVEIVTGVAPRRRFTTDQKLAVVAETIQRGMSIKLCCPPSRAPTELVFRWRRLMTQGAQEAVRAEGEVVLGLGRALCGNAIECWPRSAGQFWPTPRP